MLTTTIRGADSRAPVEILFDMRPGDLFVLRTAGNALAKAKAAFDFAEDLHFPNAVRRRNTQGKVKF